MRIFNVPQQQSATPLNATQISFQPAGWVQPAPQYMACGDGCLWGPFSATCWYTGRDVYDALGGTVPIGLLHSAHGGTVVESWTSPDANPKCGPIPDNPPGSNPGGQNNASACYNAMIYPLLPMQFAAVLWSTHNPTQPLSQVPPTAPLTPLPTLCRCCCAHRRYQGESNSFDADRYACAFAAMIEDWREKLQSPRLPFIYVLLAGYSGGDNFTVIRDGQLAALRLPYTYAASALDLGDEASPQGGVHSRYKAQVGARLARWILRVVYHNETVIAEGPEVALQQITMRASADGGTVSGVIPYWLEDRRGFYINGTLGCTKCCKDGTGLVTFTVLNSTDTTVYSPVSSLSGTHDNQVVFQAKLKTPLTATADVLLRFEWFNFPECMLYNHDQLPADPFQVRVRVNSTSPSPSPRVIVRMD
jgi:hypothetical protein